MGWGRHVNSRTFHFKKEKKKKKGKTVKVRENGIHVSQWGFGPSLVLVITKKLRLGGRMLSPPSQDVLDLPPGARGCLGHLGKGTKAADSLRVVNG